MSFLCRLAFSVLASTIFILDLLHAVFEFFIYLVFTVRSKFFF